MTEEDWLNAFELEQYIDILKEIATPRRIRLLIAACLREAATLSTSAFIDIAAETAEKLADGTTSASELLGRREQAVKLVEAWGEKAQIFDSDEEADSGIEWQLHTAATWAITPTGMTVSLAQIVDESLLRVSYFSKPMDSIRDIFDNPFRPPALSRRLLTNDVVGLARGIYEERAFDRLPILADALMDAGCDDEAILAHCRTSGPHVRGCWVVDLVLGKE